MALTCSVKRCSYGGYWLKKWKDQFCDRCGCLHKEKTCACEPPFRLYPFPTRKTNPEARDKWLHIVGRRVGNKTWSPSKDSRVCSRHFRDGKPTAVNPLPCLDMGYADAECRVQRMSRFEAIKPNRQMKVKSVVLKETLVEITDDPIVEEIPAPTPKPVPSIFVLFVMFLALLQHCRNQTKEIKKLKKEVFTLKASLFKLKKQVYCDNIIKNDENVNFYTGLNCVSVFNKLHKIISQYVTRRWTDAKRTFNTLRRSRQSGHLKRKLSSQSEFLMMLMKLRLRLLNKDLAKRFNISETLCSIIFFTWLRAASIVLKNLVFVPDQEQILGSNPQKFRSIKNLHSIIDCTELFIETPKDLQLQSSTWSDYKHHNTLKLLVSCSPNSTIVFVSNAYLGRISDKALTLDCGYLDLVPLHSTVMADKGFNIAEECAKKSLNLYVPPGKRGNSQMTSEQVEKTKTIANHRILIEQVIRRLKTFRILSNEIPINIIEHIDDIVTVCAALSNLKQPIYK